jgi:hypothetical protein
MRHVPVPWFGLAALLAMFVLPFLPAWLFEGPRTVKHWPRRHVCGACGAPWTDGHSCAPGAIPAAPAPRLRGQLRRLTPVSASAQRSRPAGSAILRLRRNDEE